ncbi:MAG: TolC family protein, partial [Salinibacterium sp.]|nr:TolC family protein [Salinibacterium sp.]
MTADRILARIFRCLLIVSMACGGACSTRYWIEDADLEVDDVLDGRTKAVRTRRINELKQPLPEAESPADESLTPATDDSGGGGGGEPPVEIDLDSALAIAVRANRGYLSRREALYQSGLSYSLTEFQFSPQVSSTLSYLFADSEDAVGNHSANSGFSVRQILPTGGSLSFTSSFNGLWPEGGQASGNNSFGSSVGVNFSQPLLRGGGYLVAWESLTQAQRSLIYSIRDFEMFREDFSIDVANRFFDLVSQKESLNNQERRYEEAVFDRELAEALRSVDRQDDQAVFIARRQEIIANNDLLTARATYDRALDEFKIFLGMTTSTEIVIKEVQPPFDPVRIDRDSAVEVARNNRLDIRTQRERLEDSRRGLMIAEDS